VSQREVKGCKNYHFKIKLKEENVNFTPLRDKRSKKNKLQEENEILGLS
jgi:hypothetical protein